MVRTVVDGLRETAASKANKFEQAMSTMKDSSSCIKDEWTSYSKKAESNYVKDTAAVECGKKDMGEFEKGENGVITMEQCPGILTQFREDQYHDLVGQHAVFNEHGTVSSATHICPYVAYVQPIHPSTSSNTSANVPELFVT
nr:kinesin-like protein KIN-5D [Tanacetum cinerariifolium]